MNSFSDEVFKQNRKVKIQMQAKNNARAATYGPFKTTACTHANNLALGNVDPPEQQAYVTTCRPREVVGPPTEVVACPTLTPRDQTLNYTENELPASFSRASLRSCPIIFALARTPGNKARECRGCCCGSPAGYLRGICAAVLPC